MSDNVLPTNAFVVMGLIAAVPLVLWMGRRSRIGGASVLVRLAFAVYAVVLVALLYTPLPLPPWTRMPRGAWMPLARGHSHG